MDADGLGVGQVQSWWCVEQQVGTDVLLQREKVTVLGAAVFCERRRKGSLKGCVMLEISWQCDLEREMWTSFKRWN